MILIGRQIFSHLEDEVSLPAYWYSMAVLHKKTHPKKQDDCGICTEVFTILPDKFGSEDFTRSLGAKSHVVRKRKDYEAIERERQEGNRRLAEQRRRDRMLKLSFTNTKLRKK